MSSLVVLMSDLSILTRQKCIRCLVAASNNEHSSISLLTTNYVSLDSTQSICLTRTTYMSV
jgi:hypothetical protein